MLLGMRRARIVEELTTDESFRRAEVELLDDIYRETDEAKRAAVQAMLAKSFQAALPLPPEDEAKGAVRELLAGEIPLGVLTDLVSFALPLPASLKRALLAECDVDRRARALLGALKNGAPDQCINIERQSTAAPAPSKGFPPRFSAN